MNLAKEGHWGPRQQRRQFKRQINQLRHGQSNPDLRLGDCSLIPTTCSYSKMAIHGNFQQFCYPEPNQLVYLQFSILFKAYDLGIHQFADSKIRGETYTCHTLPNQSSPSISASCNFRPWSTDKYTWKRKYAWSTATWLWFEIRLAQFWFAHCSSWKNRLLMVQYSLASYRQYTKSTGSNWVTQRYEPSGPSELFRHRHRWCEQVHPSAESRCETEAGTGGR